MTATQLQINQLRRMIAESTSETYTDTMLAAYIAARPLMDDRGQDPYCWDDSTTPPSQAANDNWIPTYDLNATAADLWEEKAAAVAAEFDFHADGGIYSRSQKYEQYMNRARYYRSRAAAGTIRLIMHPLLENPLGSDLHN